MGGPTGSLTLSLPEFHSRRRRIFLVGYLGDWRRAAAVLLERESLRGDTAPRREAGEGVAPTIASRPTGGGGLGTDFDCDGGLIARSLNAHSGRIDGESETFVTHSLRADGFDASEDGTGRGTPLVTAFTSKDHGADASDLAPTLRSMGHDKSHANGGWQVAVAFDLAQITSKTNRTSAADGLPASTMAKGSRMHVGQTSAVRRLTPRECERLQGFPDDFTLVNYRGKPAADGPRYKALGNSMAVPVVRWLGERIRLVDTIPTTGAAIA